MLTEKVGNSKKYVDFLYIFSKKCAVVLFNYSNINKYAINLKPGKQLPYRPIYNLGLVELEIFKTYIKINLANRFIWSSKSPTKAFILFI